MAIRFNRVAGSSQYATTPVEVPVHLLNPALGSVRLYLRELPAGLWREWEEDFASTRGEQQAALLKKIIAWGVAGHDPNDFLEDTPEGLKPILYKSSADTYHGLSSSIAHPETVAMYSHVLPDVVLLHSIHAALRYYHLGVIVTPQQLWDAAKTPPKSNGTPAPLAESPTT